ISAHTNARVVGSTPHDSLAPVGGALRPRVESCVPVLPVDKPLGLTSHDVVARARRILGTRRVGHAGTLDPLATGVLTLLSDDATKLSPYLTGSDKTYLAWVA